MNAATQSSEEGSRKEGEVDGVMCLHDGVQVALLLLVVAILDL